MHLVFPILFPRFFISRVASICDLFLVFPFLGLKQFYFFPLYPFHCIFLDFFKGFAYFFLKYLYNLHKLRFKIIVWLFRYIRISRACCQWRTAYDGAKLHWLLLIVLLWLPLAMCLYVVLARIVVPGSMRYIHFLNFRPEFDYN